MKRQKIVHSYVEEDDDFADESDLQDQLQQCICNNTVPNQIPATRVNMPENGDTAKPGHWTMD